MEHNTKPYKFNPNLDQVPVQSILVEIVGGSIGYEMKKIECGKKFKDISDIITFIVNKVSLQKITFNMDDEVCQTAKGDILVIYI